MGWQSRRAPETRHDGSQVLDEEHQEFAYAIPPPLVPMSVVRGLPAARQTGAQRRYQTGVQGLGYNLTKRTPQPPISHARQLALLIPLGASSLNSPMLAVRNARRNSVRLGLPIEWLAAGSSGRASRAQRQRMPPTITHNTVRGVSSREGPSAQMGTLSVEILIWTNKPHRFPQGPPLLVEI
jgi:hypothetical protein